MHEYASQMIWRVKEGNGEAIYFLGINDDGTFYIWTKKEQKETLDNFKIIVKTAKMKIIKFTKIYYKHENKLS